MQPRTAEIKVIVDLDGNHLPTRIEWQATEGQDGPVSSQAIMLSFWDGEKKAAAAIDLWLEDMTIEDMDLFFYQTIHKMADTYLRATKNADAAKSIHDFGDEFGETMGLVSRVGNT